MWAADGRRKRYKAHQALSGIPTNHSGSQPIQSPFGFHLIEVLERRVQDVSADRQRAAARQILRERKMDEAYQDWLRQIRDRAYVELRLEEN